MKNQMYEGNMVEASREEIDRGHGPIKGLPCTKVHGD